VLVHRLGHCLVAATLIASARAAVAAPVHVDVSQLVDEKMALHGMTVATASSDVRVGKWTVSVWQSFVQDNLADRPKFGQRPSLADIRQRTRRGFRDLSASAQRSFRLKKGLRFDFTMASTMPMGGPFGTRRVDNSADAMFEWDSGPTSLWGGVTQHMRMAGTPDTRKELTEFYAGIGRDLDDLTSVRATYYHGQSDEIRSRPTTNVALSVNHELRDLGSVGVSASRSKDSISEDRRASVSLDLNKLPF
jgi:hypothetical protein